MGKIFISYARADDEPFVKQLYQDLKERGFDIWWDREKMESRGLTFLQEIRDAIEGSDRLIAVIGPNAVKSEYVKVEWEHALLFSKGVVPILRGGLDPPGKNDYDIVPPELSKFHCPDFRKERSYQDALAELVRVLTEPVPLLGAFRTAVPSLPPHFLPRRDELVLLVNAVLADIKRPEVVNNGRQRTVIMGMGGMGKSVLAAAFARSTETRRAFTDGVAWISIGQNPDMLSNLRQLGGAFYDKMENYVDLKTARDKLPGVLADKVCLIVLDDIWDVAHAEPFINALGPRCRLLITTRDRGIASAIEANEHCLGVLSDAIALRFLANWCGKEVDSLPPEAVSVAEKCGKLPFALALCGAMARDGTAWPDMLDALKEADLTFIEKKFPNYPYTDVLKSLKISVDALANEDPEAVKHYQKLVVFHSHKKIPEAAIMTLWMHADGLKERNARKLLTTLNGKALLTLEGESPHHFATLHDLQHDYLRAIEGDQKKLHVELLEAYQEKCTDGWPGGPNDGYFFENLAYHLVEAGGKEELRGLLLDLGWIHAKLEANDVYSLIKDYNFISDDRTLCLVQGAMQLSAHILIRDKMQIRSQLYGRLIGLDEPDMETLIDRIKQWKDGGWLRTLSQTLTPPGGPLMRTLEGHTGPVYAVSVLPDGKRAISGSDDCTLKIWDMENGKLLHTLKGHTYYVLSISVLPNGKRAISGSYDKTLKVWDMETGVEIRTLKGHTGSVKAVSVTPDGKRAISASGDNTLKVWDLENGKLLHTLHTGQVTAVSFLPNGKQAISDSYDDTLKVWDLEKGEIIHALKGHTHTVKAISVLPDGKRAISGSVDRTIKVWDLEKGEILHTLQGHTGSVAAVSVLPDGKRAISGSWDATIKVWDLENGKVLRTLEGHTGSVTSVSVLPDGKRAISGSYDDTLKVWDLEKREVMNTQCHTDKVTTLSVLLDGKRAISGSVDRTLKVWDLEKGEIIHTLRGHTSRVETLSFLPDGKRAISGSRDGTLIVWDLELGKILQTLKGHFDSVTSVSVLPDRKRAISGSNDHTIIVWDIESGNVLNTLEGHISCINAVSVLPDGKRAISGSDDSTLKIWNLENGKLLHTLEGHTYTVTAVSVLPDGKRAISGSDDCTLKIWDIENGKLLHTLEGHTNSVTAVSVLPGGKNAISGSRDCTLKVWDMERGEVLNTLEGHMYTVTAVSVLPDGKRAISGSGDITLKVWNLEKGVAIASFSGDGRLSIITVTQDGKTIVAGELSGRVHILRLEEGE